MSVLCNVTKRHERVLLFTGTLPSPKETIKGNIKTITEYKIDEDGKKFKVMSHNNLFYRTCGHLPYSDCKQ